MTNEPFSYTVLARDIPAEGRRFQIEADAGQRDALAALLELPAIEALTADVEVRPVRGSAFRIRGRLTASLVQTDVVSLEPVNQHVEEEIDVTLMRAEGAASRRRPDHELVDAAEADGPDLYRNGRIDLGVIAGEHLALGLDPYPRAPDADFPGHVEDDPATDPSPFSVLAALKPRVE